MGYSVQLPPRQPVTPSLAGSPIPAKPVTLVTGGNRPAAEPLPALDAKTLIEVLGPAPSTAEIRAVAREVAQALARLRQEIASGHLTTGPLLVRGRPLADWIPLAEVARLLAAWGAGSQRRGNAS